MSEEEILNSDLRYVFELVDIHIAMNNPEEQGLNKMKKEPEKAVYIDSIKF